ncbi:DUF1573 domain-containing protein [Fimbriiglobus ruber]|nr:DUF1573 domain-containing protein [Fimbriiglobus ruber]
MTRYILIVLLTVSFAAVWGVAWYSKRGSSPGVPTIHVPEFIDLGECEAGQIATSEFDIANDGTAELNIAGVHAACSCTGLETKQPDGQYSKVEAVTILPGERKTFVVRLAVNGPPGESLTSGFHFQTDDPARPEVNLAVRLRRIRSGAFSQPVAFAFGTTSVSQPVFKVVDIIDAVSPPRAVDRVATSNSELVRLTQLAVPEAEAAIPGGRIVARVRIDVATQTPAEIDERVNVWLVNEAPSSPVSIRVLGRVAAPVEFAPKTLVLLPTAGDVRQGTFLCVTHGRPATVRVVECPSGFTAHFDSEVAPTAPRRLVVARTTLGSAADAQIRVGVTLDGIETVHTLQVTCATD